MKASAGLRTAPVPSCSNVLMLRDVERVERIGELWCPAERTFVGVLIDWDYDRML